MTTQLTLSWLSPDNRLSPGRWVKGGSRHHRRVEATELELGLRVRCHDCGVIARHNYRRAVLDADKAVVVPESDPLPWALDRLDSTSCEPLSVQVPLFDADFDLSIPGRDCD